MEFAVSKSSGSSWVDDENVEQPPCEGAVLSDVLRIDQRTFKTSDEHDKMNPRHPWLSEGMNHRTTKVGIARDIPSKTWVIDIDGLDGLLVFSEKVGHKVIVTPLEYSDFYGLPAIEIYDGWRE